MASSFVMEIRRDLVYLTYWATRIHIICNGESEFWVSHCLWLKIYCLFLLFSYYNVAGILDRGIQIDGLGMKSFVTYESNILFALRFMIDCNIVGGNWIEVLTGKYKKTAKNLSYCQLEFDCLYPNAWKLINIYLYITYHYYNLLYKNIICGLIPLTHLKFFKFGKPCSRGRIL